MSHRLAAQDKPMEPETTIQCVRQTFPATLKLTPFGIQLQETLPSTVAEPTGAAAPMNM